MSDGLPSASASVHSIGWLKKRFTQVRVPIWIGASRISRVSISYYLLG
jgi:hypothetical protein